MTPTLRDPLLDATRHLFMRAGIESQSLEQLIAALDVAPTAFHEMFRDKADLVMQVTLYDIERQKREHTALFNRVPNPVGRLLGLLEMGIRDLQKVTAPSYFADLMQHYPAAWETGQQHLMSYSYPQLQQLLNEGVRQKLMRGDINIGLVSKIIIEQLNLMLNEQVFPSSRYNIAEVFRNVYLYYFRGLCTDEGMQAAAAHFASM